DWGNSSGDRNTVLPACGVPVMDALKQQIVQRLPYLRRYARALTGSQAVGDQYIRGCLETLLQEPSAITGTGILSVQLSRLFPRFADAVHSEPQRTGDDIANLADPVERRVGEKLSALAPRDRQALLLVHQEGFSSAEAGEILGMSTA